MNDKPTPPLTEDEVLKAMAKAKALWAERDDVLKKMQPLQEKADALKAEWVLLMEKISACCQYVEKK